MTSDSGDTRKSPSGVQGCRGLRDSEAETVCLISHVNVAISQTILWSPSRRRTSPPPSSILVQYLVYNTSNNWVRDLPDTKPRWRSHMKLLAPENPGSEFGDHTVSAAARTYNGVLGQSSQQGQGAEPLVRGTKPQNLKALLHLRNMRSWPICPKICFCRTKNFAGLGTGGMAPWQPWIHQWSLSITWSRKAFFHNFSINNTRPRVSALVNCTAHTSRRQTYFTANNLRLCSEICAVVQFDSLSS